MKIKHLIFLIIVSLFIIPFNVKAATLNLFYGAECPHCAAEEEYLKTLEEEMGDELTINRYEVWHNKENSDLLAKVSKKLKNKQNGVPCTVIGTTVLVGYNDNTKTQIKKLLKEDEAKIDTVKYIKEDKKIPKTTSSKSSEVTVPILGKVSATDVSLPLLALVIGLVDGFNPCAMWVLLFLITMLLQMKDKKRMLTLGITFLVASALVYTLFMVAWLNIAVSAMQQVLLRSLIAVVALIAGVFSLRSYYKSKDDPDGCEVVDDKKRKKILEKIKKFTREKSFVLAIAGVITLAVSVNLIELACSAGLPLLFTSVLALNDLSVAAYAFNIFIYILFFLIDDIIVFLIAVKTMEVTGLSTKYAKYTHLVGGIIMLLIGVLLLVKPEWIMLNF